MKKKLLFGLMLTVSLAAFTHNTYYPSAQHNIVRQRPATNFFEGAVLGNGALGVVITTRPDAICLHFGHNNVWDIRIAENHREQLGNFQEVFAKADAIPDSLESIHHDEWFSHYLQLSAKNYNHPYPRPFPCGTVLLGFDRKQVELIGHSLDISTGICRVTLLEKGEIRYLQVFTDMEKDHVWLQLCDTTGQIVPSCFNRIRVLPDHTTPSEFPRYQSFSTENSIGFSQILPKNTDGSRSEKDKFFSLQFASNQKLLQGTRSTTLGKEQPLAELERYLASNDKGFVATIALQEGFACNLGNFEQKPVTPPTQERLLKTREGCDSIWSDYWNKSGVCFSDKELESIWYRNLYFFNCALKQGSACPRLFANWSHGNIGTAWHGDYHLNYNTQQPFWLCFSSNHLEKNLVYADLVEHLLPISRQWAKEYYGMRGAFFPHSAYPVDMSLHPYPVPDWGWEVFETPWTVQGLWWHYLYSADKNFLQQRGFPAIKEAVMFLVDYMTREDAHGHRWNDNKYHIFPSVPPELYGLQPGFRFNYDTQIDIALSRFIFKAYLQAIEDLGLKSKEKTLALQVKKILAAMPEYPSYQSEEFGKIYVSVPGENDKMVYNVPSTLTHVFPGEEFGIGAPDSIYTMLLNTARAHQNEGGNDIVFFPMQKARLGILDIEQFKRQVNYATLPNGTVTDAVMQRGGRYDDNTDYMYMAEMGIWFENFALPAVINECLMQSYHGTIHLFPNWNLQENAAFRTLRARGAFLVSAQVLDGRIQPVTIFSEQGLSCRVRNPWKDCQVRIVSKHGESILSGEMLTFNTQKNTNYTLTPILAEN